MTSLVVQWLRLLASNAGDAGSIPGGETKIAHATRRGHIHTHTQKKQQQRDEHVFVLAV